nr:hypothetical protein HmN_000804300 [Hymenolepis microstoma]
MKNLSLLWVGEDIHATEPEINIGSLRRPYYISMGTEESLILGGLRDPQSNYIRIWSRLNKSLISPNHASIERYLDGFVISDHSVTGTYVNNVRILKSTPLSDGDVICFGNESDASIKPGAAVETVQSDLKYRVLIEPDFQVPQSNNERLSTSCQSNFAKAPGNEIVPISDIMDLTENENSNVVNSEVFTQATNIGYMQHSPTNDDDNDEETSPINIRETFEVFKIPTYQNNPDNPVNEEATMSELSKNSKEVLFDANGEPNPLDIVRLLRKVVSSSMRETKSCPQR